jgi:hypothetical protein
MSLLSSALRPEPRMTGSACAVEALLGEEFADFLFDEVDEVLVVNHVALVEEDDDLRHADLLGEEDVLAGLRHDAVGRGNDETAPSIWAAPVIMFLM